VLGHDMVLGQVCKQGQGDKEQACMGQGQACMGQGHGQLRHKPRGQPMKEGQTSL
jgi:hypothetical protein